MKLKFKYMITKRFISGLLKGITIHETTDVAFRKGQTIIGAIGGSDYEILNVVAY